MGTWQDITLDANGLGYNTPNHSGEWWILNRSSSSITLNTGKSTPRGIQRLVIAANAAVKVYLEESATVEITGTAASLISITDTFDIEVLPTGSLDVRTKAQSTISTTVPTGEYWVVIQADIQAMNASKNAGLIVKDANGVKCGGLGNGVYGQDSLSINQATPPGGSPTTITLGTGTLSSTFEFGLNAGFSRLYLEPNWTIAALQVTIGITYVVFTSRPAALAFFH